MQGGRSPNGSSAAPACTPIARPSFPRRGRRPTSSWIRPRIGLAARSWLIPAGRATEKNVTGNPRKLQLVLLDAPQMPRALPEMDAAAILGNHVIAAGMLLSSALALEDPAPQYRIILAARDDVAKGPLVARLVEGYKSDAYRRFVENDPKAKGFSRPEYWR